MKKQLFIERVYVVDGEEAIDTRIEIKSYVPSEEGNGFEYISNNGTAHYCWDGDFYSLPSWWRIVES